MAGGVENEDRVTNAAAMYDGEASTEDYGDQVEAVMGGAAAVDAAEDNSTKTTTTTVVMTAATMMAAATTTAATTMTRRQQQRARPWKGRHNIDMAGKGGGKHRDY
jgi:hypothetical protein